MTECLINGVGAEASIGILQEHVGMQALADELFPRQPVLDFAFIRIRSDFSYSKLAIRHSDEFSVFLSDVWMGKKLVMVPGFYAYKMSLPTLLSKELLLPSQSRIEVIQQHEGFYDFYGVAFGCSITDVDMEDLQPSQHWISSFQNQAEDLISQVEQPSKTQKLDDVWFVERRTSFKKILHIDNDPASDGALALMLLSKQELSCVRYLKSGFFPSEISRKMDISTRTVEAHITNAKQKLRCFKRSALFSCAEAIGVRSISQAAM